MADKVMISKETMENAFSYDDYREALDGMLSTESGSNGLINYEDENLVEYTKLNVSRMQRLDKTTRLSEELIKAARKLNRSVIWLLITEGWCGDAAHSTPIVAEVASESENIDLRVILRDNNPKVMDMFLTDGKRSIPKLVVLDAHTKDVIGMWGPRPTPLQDSLPQMQVDADGDKDTLMTAVQKWYNKDKSKTIMKELAALLKEIDAA
ncbi:thioredoxin family protein [Limibacter armeniacum]|uniref:thioredoxin family protein n=1 Tax=Limibacter armeniacum TaxID=466084 RepID=UPI002FE61BA3